jgi:hypothetical protein
MRQQRSGKAVTNEREYPYIVEFAVDDDMLDVELSRRMLDFHRSRKIQARHGRRIIGGSHIYYRWSFSRFGHGQRFQGTVRRRTSAVRTVKTLARDEARRIASAALQPCALNADQTWTI